MFNKPNKTKDMKIIIEILDKTLEKDLTACGYEDIKYFIAQAFKCTEDKIKVYDALQSLSRTEASTALFNAVAKDYLTQ